MTAAANRSRVDDVGEPSRVADPVVDRQPIGLVPPSRRLDQRGRDVDAGDADPLLGERPAEHSLAARHVEHTFARLGIELASRCAG